MFFFAFQAPRLLPRRYVTPGTLSSYRDVSHLGPLITHCNSLKGLDEWEQRPNVRNLWYSDPPGADKVSLQIHL